MKTGLIGRHLSRWPVPILEWGNNVHDYLAWETEQQNKYPELGWHELVTFSRRIGEDFLKHAGLCYRSPVYKRDGRWTTEAPPAGSERGSYIVATLHMYVLQLGFKRDSAEELAARLIEKAGRVESAAARGHIDNALKEAIELGMLIRLYQVYASETNSGKKSGRSAKRCPWADALAAELRASFGTERGAFSEAWKSLRDDERLDVFIDTDDKGREVLKYEGRKYKSAAITRETFRTEYWKLKPEKR